VQSLRYELEHPVRQALERRALAHILDECVSAGESNPPTTVQGLIYPAGPPHGMILSHSARGKRSMPANNVRNILKATILAAFASCGLIASSVFGAAAGLSAQDMVDIQQLYARYNIAIDSGDAEGWAATFTPDGIFNAISGHDALANFVKTWREKLNGASRRHWNNNLQLTGNSKEASGFVFLMLIDISTKPISIVGTATYTDRLVKTKDGWRFNKRTTRGDVPPAAPAGDDARREN
jgi:hypothetical protein